MYTNAAAPLTAGIGGASVLAMTGANVFWDVLAGFALLAAGLAVKRVLPRKEG